MRNWSEILKDLVNSREGIRSLALRSEGVSHLLGGLL